MARLLPLLFVVWFSAFSKAQEPVLASARCFAVVFSWQDPPPVTREAHSWATVIRVRPTPMGSVVERETISWLPADGHNRVFTLRAEAGRNYSLEETLAMACRKNVRVSMWGPYEIREPLFEAFVRRKAELDSCGFRYRAIDSFVRETKNVNCIHAITDIDRHFERGRYPLFRIGDRASKFVVDQMLTRGVVLDPSRTQDEVLPLFGLEGHDIRRREPPPPSAYPVSDLIYRIRTRGEP